MTSPTSSAHRLRAGRIAAEDGFSLLEVVVAMVILGLTVSVVGGILINTLGTVRQNAQRVTAGNLAQQQIEAVRSMRALDIPDGTTTPVSDLLVDGTRYTVVQDAAYVEASAADSICKSGGSTLAYKRVTATVTWPAMGSTKPVRADTVVSLGLGDNGLSDDTGVAAVQLQDATAQPLAGVAVALSTGAVRTTGADGCAVFSALPPGTYRASVNQTDHVGIDGGQAVTTADFTVSAADVARPVLDYSRKSALAITVVSPAGYMPPAPVPVTLNFPLFAQASRPFPDCAAVPTAPQSCVSGASVRTAQALFPGTYSAWAGTCADAQVATAATQTVAAGATAAYSVALAGVLVQVRRNGSPASGETVYAVHRADAGCPTDVVWQLPAVSDVRVALPQGTWTFATTNDLSSPPPDGWPTVTLAAGVTDPQARVVTVP